MINIIFMMISALYAVEITHATSNLDLLAFSEIYIDETSKKNWMRSKHSAVNFKKTTNPVSNTATPHLSSFG